MPGSVSVFDTIVREAVKLCAPAKVVDIGPGGGKYGLMLRSLEQETGRPILKTCVEIDREKIIERLGLADIYDEIINEDAARLAKRHPTLTGDVAIIGDMIEHITKSEGVDLIEYLQYRFRHIFLVIPVDFVSYSFEDYENESHIAIWRVEDFRRFEGAYCVERSMGGCRFLLAAVNAITLRPQDHFVVKDLMPALARTAGSEEGIAYGFLYR